MSEEQKWLKPSELPPDFRGKAWFTWKFPYGDKFSSPKIVEIWCRTYKNRQSFVYFDKETRCESGLKEKEHRILPIVIPPAPLVEKE